MIEHSREPEKGCKVVVTGCIQISAFAACHSHSPDIIGFPGARFWNPSVF
jgi:hypothetical protein